MKKILAVIMLLMLSICLVGCGGPKGENVKISTAGPARVTFYPVCPECKHVDDLDGENISEGEEYNGVRFCSKCGEMYDISIKR